MRASHSDSRLVESLSLRLEHLDHEPVILDGTDNGHPEEAGARWWLHAGLAWEEAAVDDVLHGRGLRM
jgi:hypothetical protein